MSDRGVPVADTTFRLDIDTAFDAREALYMYTPGTTTGNVVGIPPYRPCRIGQLK